MTDRQRYLHDGLYPAIDAALFASLITSFLIALT
jgi:hypothetical protein